MSKPTPTFGSFTTVTPNGRSCGTINQFVVIADADNIYDVRWCAIGDPTDWPTPNTDDARAKQAGSQELPSQYGKVTGIAGNDFFGYVFQERAVTKMAYVGGDVVFTFDTFEVGRGCWDFNRYEQVDDTVFYESEFGYHALTNDVVVNIGYGKVDRTYPPTAPADGEQRNVAINKAIDTVFFESRNLTYNYRTDQWTRTPAFANFNYFSIDDSGGIVGRSETLAGGAQALFGDQSGGTAATATVETGEYNLNVGGRAVVNGVRPLQNVVNVPTITIGVRAGLDFAAVTSTGTSVNARSGMANFRGGANVAEGRYHSTKLVYPLGFTSVSGVEFDFAPTGKV
jgi:hypothetical protein